MKRIKRNERDWNGLPLGLKWIASDRKGMKMIEKNRNELKGIKLSWKGSKVIKRDYRGLKGFNWMAGIKMD